MLYTKCALNRAQGDWKGAWRNPMGRKCSKSWSDWWWTEKPRVLQSMGLQRVRHNWATELTDDYIYSSIHMWKFSKLYIHLRFVHLLEIIPQIFYMTFLKRFQSMTSLFQGMWGKKSQISFSFSKKNQAYRSKVIHFIFFCQNEEEKQVFQLSSITDLTNVCHRQLSLNLKIFLLRIKKKVRKTKRT